MEVDAGRFSGAIFDDFSKINFGGARVGSRL